MNDPKIVIFANCHGYYFERDLYKYIPDLKEGSITNFVSYENLNNFKEIEPHFKSADLIIIQPVSDENYSNFSVENILSIKKNSANLIKVPYARFYGYFTNSLATLSKLGRAVVTDFPLLKDKDSVDDFLINEPIDTKLIKENFNYCLESLKGIESRSDIPFVDFFVKHHQEYPMFKEYKHPTPNLMNEISRKVVIKSSKLLELKQEEIKLSLNKSPKLGGHYMPIQDKVKIELGLNYNLDEIFIVDRKKYLESVINYELDPNTTKTNDYNFFEQNFLLN